MANELKTRFTSGQTVYAMLLNAAGQIWRTDTHVFEAPTAGDWTNYAIALTEQSTTGIYEGNFPTQVAVAGVNPYSVMFLQRAGASPATTDQPNGMLGGTVYWNGTTLGEVFSSTGTPPTVTQIATAIWQDLTSSADFTTNGSIGKLLANGGTAPTAAQIATAIWQDLTSSADFTTNGSIGKALSAGVPTTDAIAAAIGALGFINFSLVSSVMQNGSITIVAGDDYFNADGRAFTWSATAGAWPNLAGATITLKGKQLPSSTSSGSGTYNVAGVVSQSGTGPQAVYVEIPASVTGLLAIGAAGYDFALVATLSDGHVATLAQGVVTVKAQS